MTKTIDTWEGAAKQAMEHLTEANQIMTWLIDHIPEGYSKIMGDAEDLQVAILDEAMPCARCLVTSIRNNESDQTYKHVIEIDPTMKGCA